MRDLVRMEAWGARAAAERLRGTANRKRDINRRQDILRTVRTDYRSMAKDGVISGEEWRFLREKLAAGGVPEAVLDELESRLHAREGKVAKDGRGDFGFALDDARTAALDDLDMLSSELRWDIQRDSYQYREQFELASRLTKNAHDIAMAIIRNI